MEHGTIEVVSHIRATDEFAIISTNMTPNTSSINMKNSFSLSCEWRERKKPHEEKQSFFLHAANLPPVRIFPT
jgi:hypothetical protein